MTDKDLQDAFFFGLVKGLPFGEKGQLRPTTPEDEQQLIEETERKMTEPAATPLQQAMAAKLQADMDDLMAWAQTVPQEDK